MGKSTISMAISNSELLNYQRVYHQQYVAFGCVWKCLKMIIPQYTPPNCYLDTSGNLTMVVAQTAPPSMRIGWSSVHPILEPVLSGVWKLGVPPNSWHVKVGNYGEPLDFGVSHFQVPIFQIKLDVCVCIYIYILADIHTYVCIYIHTYIWIDINTCIHIYMCVTYIFQ